MKLYETPDYQALSRLTGRFIASYVTLNPACTLGLATGSTPIGAYAYLVEQYKKGELDFSKVHTVNLDEYRGLSDDHPQSYRRFMQEQLFAQINIPRENTNVPNGAAADADAECRRYDSLIAGLGGIDLQLLGIGNDGHIGFNEPSTHFPLGTNIAKLTDETIEANSRFFSSKSEVPTEALTMGIGAIMSAKKILIAISGANKAAALCAAFAGPITPAMPASILQLHPDLTLIADHAALAAFKKTDAYHACR